MTRAASGAGGRLTLPPPTIRHYHAEVMTADARQREVQATLLWVLAANLGVAAAKAVYALISGSVSMGADAVHSVIDSSTNVIGLVSLRYAAAPADPEHPYGHHKLEILAAAAIGLLILAGAIVFGREAIEALQGTRPAPDVGPLGYAIAGGTIAVNALVSRLERRAGERLGSPFLLADAAHTGSDVFVSLAVLASLVAARLGYPLADPVVAIVVLTLVARIGWAVLKPNLAVLVDAAALDAGAIAEAALAEPGVRGVHRVRSRGTATAVQLDLHLHVDGESTVTAAHELAHRVEDRLRVRFPALGDVTIHIEPAGDPEESL